MLGSHIIKPDIKRNRLRRLKLPMEEKMELTEAEQIYFFGDCIKCICNEGIHDGNRVDCGCKKCH